MVIEPVWIMLFYIVAGMAMYAVFGGADFGAGVWELNTRFKASDAEKQLVYRAIGPVWEANHVWLIFVMILFWTTFPLSFAQACRIAFVPLFLALAGIVFRGAAYAFRTALKEIDWHRRTWERVFGIASTAAPFFMGVAVGTLSNLPTETPSTPARTWFELEQVEVANQWISWITPQSLFLGFFAVGLCAFQASVFLYREAVVSKELELIPVWRRRALAMSVVVGALAIAGLFVVRAGFPELWHGICNYGWPLVVLSITCGMASTYSLWRRYLRTAVVCSASAVAFVIAAWGMSARILGRTESIIYGDPPVVDLVLWILVGCVTAGVVIILPPLIWLMRIFKASEQKSTGGLKSDRKPD